jgi:hypothetical protein
MIERYFVHTFTLESISSTLTTLNPPAQTNTVNLTLSEDTNVGIKIGGFTTGNGTVTLQGDSIETITFPGNGELISLNTFTSITTVAINNLTDEDTVGTIEFYQCTPVGSPIPFRTTVGTNYKGRVSNRKRSFNNVQSGVEVNTNPMLFTMYNYSINVKDYVQAVGRTFEVLSVNYPADLFGNINHQEVELLEIEDSNNP